MARKTGGQGFDGIRPVQSGITQDNVERPKQSCFGVCVIGGHQLFDVLLIESSHIFEVMSLRPDKVATVRNVRGNIKKGGICGTMDCC